VISFGAKKHTSDKCPTPYNTIPRSEQSLLNCTTRLAIRRHCMSWVYAASHPSSYTLKPACWIRLQSDPGVEQHPAYISGNLPIPKFFDETPGPDAKVKTLDAISFLLSPNIVSESIKAQINLQTAPHGLMTQRSQDLQVEAKLPTTLTQWRAWIHGTAKMRRWMQSAPYLECRMSLLEGDSLARDGLGFKENSHSWVLQRQNPTVCLGE